MLAVVVLVGIGVLAYGSWRAVKRRLPKSSGLVVTLNSNRVVLMVAAVVGRRHMRVCNEGRGGGSELAELAIDIEDQLVEEICDASDRIIQVLQEITEAETDDDLL